MIKKIFLLWIFFSAFAVMAEKKPYDIVDGAVDFGTYNGFRRFHATCHVCHGKDALGSSIAPSLVESLKTLTYEEFKTTVSDGRSVTVAGQTRVMPMFKENKDVMKYLDDLYAYIKARSDGAIGTGRPKKQKKKKTN